MVLNIGFYEIVVLLFSLCIQIVLHTAVRRDIFNELKNASAMTRSFATREGVSAIIFNISISLYYVLRIYQWSLGHYGYVLMDIAVIILLLIAYTLTYPFIIDTLEDISVVYKDKLKYTKY